MPTKAFALEIKELQDTGEFSGRASVYDVIDAGNEVIRPSAFAKSIRESGTTIPLLWRHDAPIGTVHLRDTSAALEVDGKLFLKLELARDALTLARGGAIKGLSVGFQTIRDEWVGSVRYLTECKLWEISLTPFPQNQEALLTEVKTAQLDEAVRALQGLRRDVFAALSKSKR